MASRSRLTRINPRTGMAREEAARHGRVSVRDFSLGYVPDVEANLVGFRGAIESVNWMVRGGRLSWDPGWRRILLDETEDSTSFYQPFGWQLGDGGNAPGAAAVATYDSGQLGFTTIAIDAGGTFGILAGNQLVDREIENHVIHLDPGGPNDERLVVTTNTFQSGPVNTRVDFASVSSNPGGVVAWRVYRDALGVPTAPANLPGTLPQPIVAHGDVYIKDPNVVGADLTQSFHRYFVAAPPDRRQLFFLTGSTGAGDRGHLWATDSANRLVPVAFEAGVAPPLGDRFQYVDWARVNWAGRDSLTAPSRHQPGGLVFTNNTDSVYYWDFNGDAGYGAGNHWPGTVRLADADSEVGGAGFKARAVLAWGERLLFFNTEEGAAAGRFYNRLRGTALRSLGGTGAGNNPFTSPGSFATDLEDLEEEGLRLAPLGTKVAAYSRDGVVLLQSTGLFTGPLGRFFVSRDRGLLAPGALVPVGRELHFGVFDDGWWFFNSQGQWSEAGLFRGGDGGVYSKWKETFYSLLAEEFLDSMVVAYWPQLDQIRVSFARDGSGNIQTWVYHIKTDSVWPQDHLTDDVVSMSNVRTIVDPGVGSWDEIPENAWTDLPQDSWDAFGSTESLRVLSHGSRNGFAYVHDLTVSTRDGQSVGARWRTPLVSGDDPDELRQVARVVVSRRKAGSSDLTVTVSDEDGDEETPPALPAVTGDGKDVNYVDTQLTSTHHSVALTGTHPETVHSLGIWVEQTGDSKRRTE